MKTSTLLNNAKYVAMAAIAIIISSCSNDDKPVNEDEVITTVTTTLTNGTNTITLLSRDLDGDGPNAPVVTVSGNLAANTVYLGSVTFLNETVSPADDITVEVEEEATEHQVFYQIPSSLGSISYSDLDSDGNPLGLSFTLTTGTASTGNLTVVLRHLPNKAATGVSGGNIANAGGSTDAQVSFPIIVN